MTPILSGNTATMPRVGDRVRIRPLARVVSLAGVQLKAETSDLGAEGIVLDVQGVARTEEDARERRPHAVEFTVQRDDGSVVKIVRQWTAEGLGSVEVER